MHCLDDDIGTVTRTLFESLDYCVTPVMTSKKKKKKKAPSLTEFWKVSDDKTGYFSSGLSQ